MYGVTVFRLVYTPHAVTKFRLCGGRQLHSDTSLRHRFGSCFAVCRCRMHHMQAYMESAGLQEGAKVTVDRHFADLHAVLILHGSVIDMFTCQLQSKSNQICNNHQCHIAAPYRKYPEDRHFACHNAHVSILVEHAFVGEVEEYYHCVSLLLRVSYANTAFHGERKVLQQSRS